ncbi:MAG: 23S rRNA (pseudouridine(1915)-N(3))-methyltransferase RlmH [Proteobacteria bacterium]|nr:23S rRNA (pseudouridine(1915)-N(3))-methyltransferase RlmH [Pseudomonadota bacterium]
MKILFLSVGTLKKGYVKEGFGDYLTRIKRYVKVESQEVREGLGTTKAPKIDVMRKEGARLLEKVKEGDRVVALVVDAKAPDTKEFARVIEDTLACAVKRLVFITGGSYGLHESVIKRADRKLSLSNLTLPHELARLVIAEQVYRAFTIINGEPYSH